MIRDILISMRPVQWPKNLFVFAALVFSREFKDPAKVGISFLTFILFCLLSGAVYLINDIFDAAEDRSHWKKRSRPLAAGRLPARVAWSAAIVTALLSLITAFVVINVELGWVALAYFVVMVGYSVFLKRVVIIDVLVIAFGFVLRALAGGKAIGVPISVWLYICTFLLALFLALSKRRHELVLLEESAAAHRKILAEYSPYLLDQMIAVVTSSTVMAYALYTLNDRTIREVSDKLYFSIPFVMYGIFRYLYLVHREAEGGEPERLLFSDPPLLIGVALWVLSVFLILQWG